MSLTDSDARPVIETETDATNRSPATAGDRCCPMSPAAELSALLSRMATLARATVGVSGAYRSPCRPVWPSDPSDNTANDE